MALFRPSLFTLGCCLSRNLYNCPIKVQNRTIKRWVAPTLRELEKRKKKADVKAPAPRSSYLEWNYDAEIYAFAKRLGEKFDDKLLRCALTQRSYVVQEELKGNEHSIQDNRELIKEGQEFIISCIRKKFQDKHLPDFVDVLQSYLTSEEMLSHVASYMGVKDLILSADFPVEKPTLADTFKAVVGALKQSTDENRAEIFINDFLICQLNGKDVFDIWELKNPYEYLLRLLKDKGCSEIEPRLCNQSAVNTILANYQVGLYSNKKLLGLGWGESIEIAKDTAALDAIQKLQLINKI